MNQSEIEKIKISCLIENKEIITLFTNMDSRNRHAKGPTKFCRIYSNFL